MKNKDKIHSAKNLFLKTSKLNSRVRNKNYQPLIDYMMKNPELAEKIQRFKQRVSSQVWDKNKDRNLNSLGPITEEAQVFALIK